MASIVSESVLDYFFWSFKLVSTHPGFYLRTDVVYFKNDNSSFRDQGFSLQVILAKLLEQLETQIFDTLVKRTKSRKVRLRYFLQLLKFFFIFGLQDEILSICPF